LIVALAAVCALVLPACDSNGGTSSSTTSTTSASDAGTETTSAPESTTSTSEVDDVSSDELVTLTYWSGFTGGDRGAYEDLIQEFNDTHPNIQIDYQLQPWDTIAQQTPTAIASGSGPDIVTPDYNVSTILEYVANGLAAPLDLIGDGENQIPDGVLPETLVDSFTVDGNLYAAPANFATLMLYYNVDLLGEAGYDVPPSTMEELREYAVELSDGAGQYGIALADHSTIAVWPILIWSDGGDLIKNGCSALDDAEAVSTVETWSSLIRDHQISPVGLSGDEADNLFAAGKAAMEINGPWAAGTYREAGVNFDVAPVPVGASGSPVTLGSTVPMIVSATSDHQAEAQVFLAWWLSKDAQAQLATAAAYAPSRTDMADDDAITSDSLAASFTAQVPYARLYLPDQLKFAQIDGDIFSPAIQSATQIGDALAAMQKANDQLNEVLGCE